jgi:transcriptional regulator with XRE-family HTH domain
MRKTPQRRGRKLRPKRTRLDRFIKRHDIQPKTLAEEAGLARQHIYRLRCSQGNPTLTAMLILRDACRRMTGLRVRVTDLFDLGDGE